MGRPPKAPTLRAIYERALKVHYCNNKDLKGVQAVWRTLTRFCAPEAPVTAFNRLMAEEVVLSMREATWSRGVGTQERPYSEATINRCLSLLGKLLSLARQWEHISTVPKMPKSREAATIKRRSLTPEEYTAMLQALGSHPNP